MNLASRLLIAALVCFSGTLSIPLRAQLPAPPAAPGPKPLDYQALDRGIEAINKQEYANAVKFLEELLRVYPNSPAVAEGHFRLGYALYLLGEYDKSVASFQQVPTAKGATPEIVELASSLTPQVLATKAAKLPADDPARDAALVDAVQQFDAFLQKFPQSEEAETAHSGKAMALFQLKKYD
ncbi:MAG TPA: tetratricopeptide repeat protein, partial [Chthoniobacteraceae bacterium]|nr:tetratricopeptide repeat protein [Chthoniobacteraceae bacterium]